MVKHYLSVLFVFFISFSSFGQGIETFTSIPANSSSYSTRNWTGDNGLPWAATDSRTDLNLNGRAIGVRNGSVTCSNVPNGIGNLSFKNQQNFTGSNPVLQVYVNNILIGTASPTITVATATINNINVSGTFNLEIRQVTSGLRIAIDDVSWTSFNATPCDEPAAQPTNLLLTPTPTTVSGSFDVIPDPTTVQNYLVVRSISSALTQLPIDGVTYSIGQNIGGGNGTALGITSDGTFTDNVFPSTQYYYFIFAMNDQSCGSAPNYNQINPLTNNTTTPALAACVAPVASATNIVLTPANNSITGTFTAAGDANRYLVVISTSSALSASPINSTSYTAGQAFGGGTVVSFGTTTTFSAIGLTTATQYYVFVFAANAQCTGEPFYNTTALSETATTTNNTTGIPAGYYDAAASLTCQPLKTQIRDIISTGYVQLTYTPGVWNAYQFTDLHRNDANTADIIWDIYSDNPTGLEPYTYTYGPTTSGGNQCGNYSGEGSCYNREHSTPKSWFADAYPMYSDVNHLYPTDGYVNNTRSSYPYGEVLTNAVAPSQNGSKLGTGNNFGYTGTVFEPINEYKGDLARTSLYMATRYENEIIANNWSANGTANALFLSASDEPDPAKRKLQIYDAWYLKTIFKWMSNDPVSQKEIDRNNAIYYQSGQNNRNPYIDHPEYAAIVFQCTGLLPVTITDFVGVKNNVSVLLKWYATFETSFKQYDIERSINGTNFNKIGEVAGRNLANYSFTDDNLPGGSVAYYRLKMIDIDSRSNYSKTIAIKLNNNISNALVYPNPTRGDLNIKFLHVLSANSTLQVTDVTGRIVKQQDIAAGKLNVSLDVKQLPVGRYFIKIANSTQAINQSFIVIK